MSTKKSSTTVMWEEQVVKAFLRLSDESALVDEVQDAGI